MQAKLQGYIIVKIKYVNQFFKILFALLFIGGGIAHFTNVGFYLPMMPDYLPFHLELIYLSGVIEILLGIFILIPKYTRISAVGLILLLLAVFPANINMYLNAENFKNVSQQALLIRLFIQLILIFWAYLYTRKSNRG